jgi:hypothetical protein
MLDHDSVRVAVEHVRGCIVVRPSRYDSWGYAHGRDQVFAEFRVAAGDSAPNEGGAHELEQLAPIQRFGKRCGESRKLTLRARKERRVVRRLLEAAP